MTTTSNTSTTTATSAPSSEDIEDDDPQVLDPLIAAQGLRQCLWVLAHLPDVRNIIRANSPTMLVELDDVLRMTRQVVSFKATEFEVYPFLSLPQETIEEV